MANDVLDGDRIAILVTDGFEQVELLQPRKALDEAADEKPQISSWASPRHATDAFGYA
ncbi:MAG TPA: hypothetical protein VNW24_17960 [Stellaceae bacterium]|jgi:protease I|nr:hypothetical protein [Stellaceae bacterium]